MASAIVFASLFLVTYLTGTSLAQNQNNAQGAGAGLLENKLKPLNNQQYNEFDWKLSKALDANEKSNFVVSPLSVKLALSMLYLGLQGTAAKEIEDAFNINSTLKEIVEREFSLIMRTLESKEEAYELNIGTKLFVDQTTKINENFEKKIRDYYNSSSTSVDFKNQKATMATINEWCNRITKGKIPQLVDEGDFNEATVIMLLNAIYFRGEWQYPFSANETKPQQFHVTSNRSMKVQMMSQTEKFGYYDMKDARAHLIRLPYVGDKFAMYILYPYDTDGLAAVAKNLTADILSKALMKRSEKLITLRLPKFKFESTAELVSILKQLNIKELFTEKANLESIGSSSKGPLLISNVLQKSGIEVNEKGTLAFASTNVVIDSRFGMDAIEININHPFIFLIADESQNNTIFIGKVLEPLPALNQYAPPISVLAPQAPVPNEYLSNQAGINSNQKPPADLSEKLNYFDKELLFKTHHNTKSTENIVLSPASIKVMLALLLEGATGNTEKELKDALRLPDDRQSAIDILLTQLKKLKNINTAVTVDTKNKVFIAEDEKLSKHYTDALQKNYETEFEQVKFYDPDKAISTINKWVNEVTNGLIPSLVTKDELDPSTRLLLANCIYFKGDWKYAFDPKLTVTQYFYNPGEPELKTKFMTSEIHIKYHEDRELDAKIAEIPFKDERYTFTIVLPNRKDGIAKLLKDLHHQPLLKVFGEMREQAVKITLPKTTINFKTPLAEILSKDGIDIKDTFTSKANLSGILEANRPIFVKDIYHNAKIELTEEGARAAAASASQIVLLSASFVPELKADHPFVFFIRDTHDSGFLFEGVLYVPDPSNDPVTPLSVDNRNTFDNRPPSSSVAPPSARPATTSRKPSQSQRPTTTGQQPLQSNSRPSNGQQTVNNRINGQGQGQGQQTQSQNSNNRPIIGYQAPRPTEKGSVEYPIRNESYPYQLS